MTIHQSLLPISPKQDRWKYKFNEHLLGNAPPMAAHDRNVILQNKLIWPTSGRTRDYDAESVEVISPLSIGPENRFSSSRSWDSIFFPLAIASLRISSYLCHPPRHLFHLPHFYQVSLGCTSHGIWSFRDLKFEPFLAPQRRHTVVVGTLDCSAITY